MPDEAVVCSCNNVSKARRASRRPPRTQDCTRAGTTCGSCMPMVKTLIEDYYASQGRVVDKGLCEHFSLTRQELFDLVAVHGYRRFDDIVEAHGRGRGCDVCKPAIASILASQWNAPRARPGHRRAAGHQRRLPREHPAQRHLLRRAAHPRRRDHPGEADRDRRGGQGLRALHEDHRRPADRPVRRPDGAAARDLAAAGGRRLRVRPRLRQGAAHGEVVRRLDLVPVRRAGLRRPGDRAGAALPRPALAAQAQGRRQRLRPRVRRGAGQGLRRDRHREGLEPVRRRQRRRQPRARAAAGRRPRHRDAGQLPRPVPHVLRPHRRPAAAHRPPGSTPSTAGWTGSARSSSTTRSGSGAELEAAMARHVGVVRRRVAGDARGPGEAGPVRVLRERAGHPGPEHLLRRGARPDQAGREPGTRRPRRSTIPVGAP